MRNILVFSGLLGWVALSPSVARAADDSNTAPQPMNCINEIKSTCVGYENDMEQCLADRGDKFTEACRKLLQSSLMMAKSQTGAGSCIKDIQQYCNGLETAGLAKCITDNKDHFNPACREYLSQGTESSSRTP